MGGSCRSRNRDKFCSSRTGRGVVRQQAQENLCADADPSAAKTHEEKIDGGEDADAKADRSAGEIAVIEEKERRESHSIRGSVSERLCVSEKEEAFGESVSGVFSHREQKKEAQSIADSDSVAQ